MMIVFSCLGAGFMLVEVALFQKMILFLGSPTISLSVLLSSILIGMGLGSFTAGRKNTVSGIRRLAFFSAAILGVGVIAILFYPVILEQFLSQSRLLRGVVTFVLVLPLGFVMGVPFPTCIGLMKKYELDEYIPWMYGVNGALSILGSILSVVLSMIYGFSYAFFVGLSLYLLIIVLLIWKDKNEVLAKS